MNSKFKIMSLVTNNPCSSPSIHPLKVDVVLEVMFSHLEENPKDLIKYRLVCQKWNDVIVRKVTESRISFQIPLRYDDDAPKALLKSEAKFWANKRLRNVIKIVTAAQISFDTVLIDRDFYLVAVMDKWTDFLEIHGRSIRHLKLNIRRNQFPEEFENEVTDCPEVVSRKSLLALFISTPNLESLDFCVGFWHYGSEFRLQVKRPIFHPFEIPQLHKLTKISIQEPHCLQYSLEFLKEILSMASNLTDLSFQPMRQLTTFAGALAAVESKVKGSMTSLRLSSPNVLVLNYKNDSKQFPFLHLTTLELNNIYGTNKVKWVEKLLRIQKSSLVTLILGKKEESDEILLRDNSNDFLSFPPVMECLKSLEIYLTKFNVRDARSFVIQFPVLERLKLTRDSEYQSDACLFVLLPGSLGPSTRVIRSSVLRTSTQNMEIAPNNLLRTA